MNLKARTVLFAAICLLVALVNSQLLRQLLDLSLKHEFASMIPMMPFLSAALIFRSRGKIFARVATSEVVGGSVMVAGSALAICAHFMDGRTLGADILSIKAFALVTLLIGAFLFSFGAECFCRALLPLLMLLFMIPIPEAMLQAVISTLQRGSAEASALLFKATGTPYYRDGLTFVLPRLNIEIAAQCSGIRSSLALVISCLLAAHLILKTWWRKSLFVVLVVPMAMLKNAIRIVTLSLLAIHVDKRFIVSSDLHREGGILFFTLALLLLFPILWILRRSERRADLAKESKPQTA